MNKRLVIILALSSIILNACWPNGSDDDFIDPISNSNFEPVILKRAEFENTTILESEPRTIINSGKIYVKNNFIFINELNQGFHLIENSDPSNPENIAFIKVLGSSDLSIKENVIYINNAIDLIALTIDEASETLEITKRVRDVFPQISSPDGFSFYDLEEDDIIIDWESVN